MNQPPAPPSPADVAAAAAAATTAAGGQQPPDSGGNGGPQFDPNAPSISQSHMNHLLAEQKRDLNAKFGDYADLKERAEKFDALVGTTKSVEEQAGELTAQLATRDRDLGDANLTIKAQRLAALASIHPDLWDMVKGPDEATINANIERLKAHTAAAAPQPPAGGDKQQRRGRTPGQGRPGADAGDGGGSVASGRELYESRQPKSKAGS